MTTINGIITAHQKLSPKRAAEPAAPKAPVSAKEALRRDGKRVECGASAKAIKPVSRPLYYSCREARFCSDLDAFFSL